MDEVKIQTKLGQFLLRKYLEGRIKKATGRNIELGQVDVSIQHEAGNKVRANLTCSATMTEAEFGAWIEQLIGG